MLLFDWSRIDWIKWMPYEILLLLVLIIILRIIRRSQRWGPIQVNNVEIHYHKCDQVKIPCFVKTKSTEHSPLNKKKLLFIPPIFSRVNKEYFLSVSLAQLNWDIITLSFKNLKKILQNERNPSDQLLKLLTQLEISTIVLFDYSISPILNILNDLISKEKNLKINCILIRPTINWQHITSFWKLIPFSSQWFTRVRMFLNTKWIESIENKSEGSRRENFNFPPNFKFYSIDSNVSWLSPIGKQKLLLWNKNNISDLNLYNIKINKGNWNFFRNETILIGFLSQFLDAIDKNNKS